MVKDHLTFEIKTKYKMINGQNSNYIIVKILIYVLGYNNISTGVIFFYNNIYCQVF
jgi:hypothetical protein